MRTTVFLDDELITEAKRVTGLSKTSQIVNVALRDYVERSKREWLASMGGSLPDLVAPPRRRFK